MKYLVIELQKSEDGTVALTDITALRTAAGQTLWGEVVEPSKTRALSDGKHTLECELFAAPLPFDVRGRKWNLPKQNKKAAVDPNPYGAKLSFADKTGLVKGTLSVPVPGAARPVKFVVNGVVTGGGFRGSAYNKNYGGFRISAE